MIKELRDILSAYSKAKSSGRACALATVVHVEGSSYRRPGARMLVTENGEITGAISGGCLEGDALRKALLAIQQNANKLVTYDTSDESDARFGVQLGCNGIVHILFEPLRMNDDRAIHVLEKLISTRGESVLVTGFSLSNQYQPGTIAACQRSEPNPFANGLSELLSNKIDLAFAEKNSNLIETDDVNFFIEFIPPPIQLIIAGAGNDTIPVAKMASVLGWEVSVLDWRPIQANKSRFPEANRISTGAAESVLESVRIDSETAVLLMTHNFNYDKILLSKLVHSEANYIGVLGPKTKLARMFDELKYSEEQIHMFTSTTVFGPLGFDLGAETAEEIALSAIAEILAVFRGKKGNSLRGKNSFIHSRSDNTIPHD